MGDLRAKNYQGSDEEWADILAHVFGPKRKPESSQGDWASGLEVLATVKELAKDPNELVINLRKRIAGITVRAPFAFPIKTSVGGHDNLSMIILGNLALISCFFTSLAKARCHNSQAR